MVRPPTARSAVPGVGRLGLLEPAAADSLRQLGWDNVDGVPVLWALSRSPDADLALSTLVRMRESLEAQWPELDSAIRSDTTLRGRLFGLLGSSTAFGDHLVAVPDTWKVLRRKELPSRDALIADLLDAVDATPETGPNAGPMLFRAGIAGPEA
ncbi:MAG: bifunctional [glutamine synthetase] adenylyltransferase/[glutamine synthetase]-adenylyl-L-tyrosine phosphorylase, partial [Nocardia sp.]|nr:bifunctional [glutamine synthetase] adenylyltransferase/[glutamine synthetase]-adenylyl-L-tyrosine phosphorylase [Nocardia sp.]